MQLFKEPLAFDWDKGNSGKNAKHKVSDFEAEEPFYDKNKKIFEDIKHSSGEKRYLLFGKSKSERLLIVSFTIRENKVRIISARDINRKEVQLYEKTTENT